MPAASPLMPERRRRDRLIVVLRDRRALCEVRRQHCHRLDVQADALPHLAGDREERLHHARVELRPAAADHLGARHGEGPRLAVGAVARDGVEGVDDVEDARPDHDLLGLDVDAAALFPPDDSNFGFDNIADALTTSPLLLEKYLFQKIENYTVVRWGMVK